MHKPLLQPMTSSAKGSVHINHKMYSKQCWNMLKVFTSCAEVLRFPPLKLALLLNTMEVNGITVLFTHLKELNNNMWKTQWHRVFPETLSLLLIIPTSCCFFVETISSTGSIFQWKLSTVRFRWFRVNCFWISWKHWTLWICCCWVF